MKKIFPIILLTTIISTVSAQENVLPAPPQQGATALTHATIHTGNGQVINDGTIVFANGKITSVGTAAPAGDAKVIDCSGKQIYPGLILADSYLGLIDIGSIRAMHDENEIGSLNPDVRS
jgi:imidazolonepropionase-like amidohydrolase